MKNICHIRLKQEDGYSNSLIGISTQHILELKFFLTLQLINFFRKIFINLIKINIMKKLILILLFIPFTFSCSSDSDSNDNNTLYSIVGDWDVVTYDLGETDILSGYNYLFMYFYEDGTTSTVGELLSTDLLLVNGSYQISGQNNSILTLTNEFGDVTVWTVMEVTASYVRLFSNDVLGYEATIEANRI